MKLGELKSSLSRFPTDMDDTEILVQYVSADGKEDADCLAYVAYANLQDDFVVCLGTWKMGDIQQKLHPDRFPVSYEPHPDNRNSVNKPSKPDTNEKP